MATLTRQKHERDSNQDVSTLNASIPTPFPSAEERERILQEDLLEELAQEDVVLDETYPSQRSSTRNGESSRTVQEQDVLHDIMPSIAYVQKSCLMILNNLLSVPSRWHPIVPERRHSMPSSPHSATFPEANSAQSSSALQTLVLNLRNHDTASIEHYDTLSDTELIRELATRVDTIIPSLDSTDARLAHTLVSLISHFDRLSVIQSQNSPPRADPSDTHLRSPLEPPLTADLFETLKRQLGELQVERLSRSNSYQDGSTPIPVAVESTLLWARIDEELESVLSLCKERTESLPRFTPADNLPPKYEPADYVLDVPPVYDSGTRPHVRVDTSDTKIRTNSATSPGSTTEKMRLDLEAVTMAIDRLYLVAPQLHNQRVELKSSKLEEMEKARNAGKGKQKDLQDLRELDNLLELLGKASDRKMVDQSVILDGGMKTPLEKARQRDLRKRNEFVEHLARHSDAGRFHAQDAIFPSKIKDPDAMLTLPEFIKESVPESLRLVDPEAMLSLPEFVKEPVPERVAQALALSRLKDELKDEKRRRSRSMSAPSLSWLRPSLSRSSSHVTEDKSRKVHKSNKSISTKERDPSQSYPGLDVHYVAEHHESLQHILIFLTVAGATPGVDIEAKVIPGLGGSDGDQLIITSGNNNSLPIALPCRTSPGEKEVKVQSGHYQVKLATGTLNSTENQQYDSIPLIDASQLSDSAPTSFICASCSLPLVHSSDISTYRDLPSEHWEELVDAWMCHTDQTLHEHVAKHSRGFFPESSQALVGGSYILFDESAINKNNLWKANQPKRGADWHLVRCICGAVAGRYQEHIASESSRSSVYRLAKYAIRPVSPTAEPLSAPLSAFIVEDMSEFVHAHATYRFVIFDEEGDKPRLLIWLFKPSIRLAYTSPFAYVLPKSGNIHAAKVLFKILGPSVPSSELKTILGKYPGFPQAEYLYYPIDICRRLASILKESNSAYPEGMRIMTGLDIGWLRRA